MSDSRPKVKVQQASSGQGYVAFCREPRCNWTQTPDEKTYVEQRARDHRAEHRKAAGRG